MLKKISSLLFVGIVGYTLGTMSTLYAENKAAPKVNIKTLTKKIDQILAGQKTVEKKLQQIWLKVK